MNDRDLFMAALQIEDGAVRSAWLDRACAGDAALRQRVEALLAAFARAGSFLEQPAAEPGATSDFAQTVPMPPSPSCSRSWYGPMLASAASRAEAWSAVS